MDLESALSPVLDEMRWRGVRVDLDRADEYNTRFTLEENNLLHELQKDTGFDMNPWSPDDLVRVFDSLGVSYPTTEKGNPSFEGEWLESMGDAHPTSAKIAKYRRLNKMRRDFIEGGVLRWQISGRIHGQIHALRRDDYGTRSGRLSYSNPNLQQIPYRNAFWRGIIRSLYLPEEGAGWLRADYSQQEPRFGIHYAAKRGLPGAKEAAERYRRDPGTDFHTMVSELIKEISGRDIERFPAKTINLGLDYGMGVKKLAAQLGMTYEEAKPIFADYHRAVPFKRRLRDEATQRAADRGWIRTFLGRRAHFDKWNPIDWDVRREYGYRAYPFDEARELWPHEPLCRAYTHKAYNRLIQGSAADMTKKAMIDLYDSGYVAHIQIHDELNFSTYDMDQVKDIKSIMEGCVELLVPIITDIEMGPNWGELRNYELVGEDFLEADSK